VAATDRHAPFDRSGEAGGPGARPGRTPAGLLAPRDRGAPRKFCRIGEIVEHRGHRTNEAFGISEAIDVTESDRHAPFDRSGEAGGPGAGPGRTPAGLLAPRAREARRGSSVGSVRPSSTAVTERRKRLASQRRWT